MQPIEIPKFPILRGEKAIKALYDFIDELEEQKGKELTEKQTAALIKLAKELISSIEAETRSKTSSKDIREKRLVPLVHSPLSFSIRTTSYGIFCLRGPFPTDFC